MVTDDPTVTNPHLYTVLWENEHVRVLEYLDEPGAVATPHDHPNSVMVTLSGFRRRLSLGERHQDVQLPSGTAVWLRSGTPERTSETRRPTPSWSS